MICLLKKSVRIHTLCLLAILMVINFSANAEERKDYGTLNSINHNSASLVIDDRSLKMALNFKVFNQRGKEVNRYSLKPGQKLVYTFTSNSNRTKNITQAWIKPANYEH